MRGRRAMVLWHYHLARLEPSVYCAFTRLLRRVQGVKRDRVTFAPTPLTFLHFLSFSTVWRQGVFTILYGGLGSRGFRGTRAPDLPSLKTHLSCGPPKNGWKLDISLRDFVQTANVRSMTITSETIWNYCHRKQCRVTFAPTRGSNVAPASGGGNRFSNLFKVQLGHALQKGTHMNLHDQYWLACAKTFACFQALKRVQYV